MRASPGLFIRVSLSKDKVPEPNHYFIYYTCEVRVKRKQSAFGRIYPHPGAVAPFPPKWKRTSPRSRLVTPAWLQSPGHLRRPGDFRSYCHAPARLWPPEPSTDSLDLTHNWPALGARLFQTGALPTHRCPDKPGKRGKRSRDCASCRRKRQPSQTLAGLIPPSLPREVQ